MRLLPLLALAFGTSASAACPDVGLEVDGAVADLQVLDLAATRGHLDQALVALSCGPLADRTTLARMWMAEGAWYVFSGDGPSAADSFAAAHRSDPSVFLPEFESALRAHYDRAVDREVSPGTLSIRPALGEAWVVAVDGEPVPMPAAVTSGLHVVQIAPADDLTRAAHATALLVPAQTPAVVSHDLPPIPPEPESIALSVREPIDTGLGLHLGLGASTAFGEAWTTRVDGHALEEKPTKLILPAELGLTLDVGAFWLRLHGELGPVVGGGLIYAGETTPQLAAFAWGTHVSLGGTAGPVRLGGMVGGTLPGRLGMRAVARVAFGSLPIGLEVRLGANLLTDRTAEPAAGLAFTALVPMVR